MSLEIITDKCPVYASFFGFAGSTAAIVFASVGAAYGTAKAGSGIAGMGQAKPQMIMKSLVPVVMASIVGIYGLVVAILIGSAVSAGPEYNLHSASIHLASGLATGFGGLASGWTIGVVGDAGVRCLAQQTRIFVAMVLILIFAEVLGLYGLIVALILNSKTTIGASCT